MSGFHQKTLGIIGGGQLAQMLCLKAHQMGVSVSILSPQKSDPAGLVCPQWKKGSIQSFSDISKWSREVDFITFESEFVPTAVLQKLLESQKKSPFIFPDPALMMKLQNRYSQKMWLDSHKLKTSVWMLPETTDDVLDFASQHGWPVVGKARFGGYDGYGTTIFKNANQVRKFKNQWSDLIIEKFVPFRRELAAQFARNSRGEVQVLPLVESFQKDSRCLWVKGPITHPKWSRVKNQWLRAMKTSQYVGVLAVEFFDYRGDLIVNEIAPRVHNSGHYTQDALSCSQFEYHIRAGMGFSLPKVKELSNGYAMMNVLGEKNKMGNIPNTSPGIFHWYGKQEVRKGRKMGHINALAKSPTQALNIVKTARKGVQV